MTDAVAPLWRAVIVDDEPLAREGIRSRLAALGGFEIVAECGGGRAAVAAIRSSSPDVVFLDVQMPVIDGFGVIAEIGVDAMPPIVFVTAHDQHALRAFDAHAIDYVLKPIDDARFVRAVDGVRKRLAESRESGVARRLTELLGDVRRAAPFVKSEVPRGDRLVARDGDRVELVPFAEIDWAAADGDYVRVYAGNRQLLLRLTMTRLEAELPADQLVRIHRSTIVNVTRIRTLRALPNAEYAVVLQSGITLRASRSYAGRLRDLLRLETPNEHPTGRA
jgi:two-component system, LytTR family, response regulator